MLGVIDAASYAGASRLRADPSTIELLNRLVESAEELPVLMLITSRAESKMAWTGQAHVTLLALNRISTAGH